MDFHSWDVDLSINSATHCSGFTIVVEGDPSSPMGVKPGKFPENMTAIDQATLLRSGLEALAKSAYTAAPKANRPQPTITTRVKSSTRLKDAAGAARSGPSRPILSLKRSAKLSEA